MNALENWFCSTRLWQRITHRRLLPWLLGPSDLGDHLLEIGAGPGAATAALRQLVPRVTSLELDHSFAVRLAQSHQPNSSVVQADVAALPFADHSFSSAIAILVLHHLPCAALQDRAFTEIRRVLRPGGCFFAVEIPDGWFDRLIHVHSIFIPLQVPTLSARLTTAGFTGVTLDHRPGAFRLHASR